MNAKFKKYLALSSAVVIGTSIVSVSAASFNKSLSATYNDIKVTFDGKLQAPTNEPFIVDSSVYVGLRDVGQMTNNTVNWDSANKTVHITSNTSGSNASQAEELAKKNLEIATLKREVSTLQEDLEEYKQLLADKEAAEKEEEEKFSKITHSSIKAFLKDFEDDYEDEYDVKWYFDLKFDTKKEVFNFEITFRSSYDADSFTDMTNGDFDNFITEMCEDIQSEFGEFEIVGEIVDTSKKDTLVTFTFDEDEELDMTRDYPVSVIKAFETTLYNKYKNIMTITDPVISELLPIRVSSIYLDPTSKDFSDIVFKVYTDLPSDNETRDAWNKLTTSYHTRDLDADLEDLSDDIADFFNAEEIDGYIYNADGDIIIKYEDGRLRIEEF